MCANLTACGNWSFGYRRASALAGQPNRQKHWYMGIFPFIRPPAVQAMVRVPLIFLLTNLTCFISLPNTREKSLPRTRFTILFGRRQLIKGRNPYRLSWGASVRNSMRFVPNMTTSRPNATKAICLSLNRKLPYKHFISLSYKSSQISCRL